MYAASRNQSPSETAIDLLARESHLSIGDVVRLYENELARLRVGARIHGFLAILALCKVREMLRQHGTGKRLFARAAWREIDGKGPDSAQGTPLKARFHTHLLLPATRPRLDWTCDASLL